MQIYLPIAEMSANVFLLLGLGGAVGFLSGMFGVGGGFLMTPLLIFIGVPPAVAVGTEANQIVAASVSGALAQWRRRNVDLKMGAVLLAGGLVGSTFGVWLFKLLRELGQIELVISLSFVVFLGTIGTLMLIESIGAIVRKRRPGRALRKLHHHYWIHGLPLKMRFRQSKLYISALLPLGIGFVAGMLAAIMGVGGGFLMVPAMIYLLGMPTSVVVGTSLFQIIFVTANVTFLQAVNNFTVDVLLALLLLTGGVIGAQFGARVGARLGGEELRGLLAAIVIVVCGKLVFDLVGTPEDRYTLAAVDATTTATEVIDMASPTQLDVDLWPDRITIDSGFTGAEELFYGAVDSEGDIVVVVRGPDERVVVRRKDRVAGVWVNRDSITFEGVPAFYAVASSRPLADIAPASLLAKYQIGFGALRPVPTSTRPAAEIAPFREALVRNRLRDGLYSDQTGKIGFLGDRLFRVPLHFPANVPEGEYRAQFVVFRDGKVVGTETIGLPILKGGFEARIGAIAHNQPAYYGFAAIVMALFAGWVAATLFRKP